VPRYITKATASTIVANVTGATVQTTAHSLGIFDSKSLVAFRLASNVGDVGAEVSANIYYSIDPAENPNWILFCRQVSPATMTTVINFPLQAIRIDVMTSLASAPSAGATPTWAYSILQSGT